MDDRTRRTYLAIDLKSFYASAECASRGLDPLTTNLVVADVARTEKTICLAVSPALKAYGIGGRARLFEVVEKMKRVNEERRLRAPGHRLTGEAFDSVTLAADPRLKAGYYAAKPRMAYYLKVSGRIYAIYLRYASASDIHVYSIDEVFIDVTHYLAMYRMTPHELARRIVQDIVDETGITATAGIGSNMYLAKVAMDIVAKHMPADRDGVRVAELDESNYRRLLWAHRPITDFWRVGRGYARNLESVGLLTMGDIARCSLGKAHDYYNEDLLYRMFGVNAELLIDHAWGREPCLISDIKAYRPSENSLSSGQVLHRPYSSDSARLVVREMADTISLELVDKGMATDLVGLYIGYEGKEGFEGSAPVSTNRYGKKVPRPANGSIDLGECTSSTEVITAAMVRLYDRIVDRSLMVRRLNVMVGRLRPYGATATIAGDGIGVGADTGSTGAVSTATRRPVREEQLDLFADVEQDDRDDDETRADRRREHDVQQALLAVKHRFGKNAVIKAMNLEPDATGRDRNNQIGGHAAGDEEGRAKKGRSASSQTSDSTAMSDASVGDRSGSGRNATDWTLSGTQNGARERPMTARPPKAQTQHAKPGAESVQVDMRQMASLFQPTHRYDDIIGMPSHVSRTHPPMLRLNRAAQFMPFAALTGYDEVLQESLTEFEQAHAPTSEPFEDVL